MVKSATRSLMGKLDVHGVTVPYVNFSSNIKGSYGKRNRNNCQHVKISSVLPGHITYVDPAYNSYLTSGLTRFNDETVQMVYSLYEEEIDRQVYAYMNSVAKRLYPIDLSFNLINFFIELRELPSLANPAKAVNRNIRKLKKDSRSASPRSRSRKFRRPNRSEVNSALDDVASTYVGGQFGIIPTVSDMGEVNARFNDMQSNHRRLVERLKKSPIFRKKLSISLPPLSLRLPQSLNLTPTAFVRDQKSRVTVRVKKCTVVVSGRVKYDCPDLYTFGPLLAALDTGGLKFSLSTLWNATPFSWLVDWVLPIGDALASMDKPYLDILVALDGQYSVKLELVFSFTPDGINSYFGLQQQRSKGIADATLYNRFALPSDLMAFRPPPMPSFKGAWGPKKLGILAGIAKGFRSL